jgi:hypothetical protein
VVAVLLDEGFSALPAQDGIVCVTERLPPTTRYLREQVLRKRPYLQLEWCADVLASPLVREVQADGRIRHWAFIPELGRHLRVITLEDGQTIHNAFPDRDFRPEKT